MDIGHLDMPVLPLASVTFTNIVTPNAGLEPALPLASATFTNIVTPNAELDPVMPLAPPVTFTRIVTQNVELRPVQTYTVHKPSEQVFVLMKAHNPSNAVLDSTTQGPDPQPTPDVFVGGFPLSPMHSKVPRGLPSEHQHTGFPSKHTSSSILQEIPTATASPAFGSLSPFPSTTKEASTLNSLAIYTTPLQPLLAVNPLTHPDTFSTVIIVTLSGPNSSGVSTIVNNS